MTTRMMTAALIALLAVPFSTNANAALIGHWTFNDGSGGTAVDNVNGNNGVFQGGSATWATGQIGGAVSLAGGASDRFVTNAISQLNGATNFSMSAWFNIDAAAPGAFKGIFGSRDVTDSSGASQQYAINHNAAFNSDVRFSAETMGTVAFSKNAWHHAVAVWDGGAETRSFYLDNSLVGTFPMASAVGSIQNSPTFNFGDDPCCGGREFVGLLDDFAIFNNALNVADINAIYNNGLAGINVTGSLPEPSTLLLTLAGALGLAMRRRRSRGQSSRTVGGILAS